MVKLHVCGWVGAVQVLLFTQEVIAKENYAKKSV